MTELSIDFLDDNAPIKVLAWDKDNAVEVREARKQFDDYIKKGWIAFAVSEQRRIHVYKFNPTFEKVILAPIVEGG